MALKVEHELHKRCFGRNAGLGLVLVGFAAIVFGLTISKVSQGVQIEGFDHTVRPALLPEGGN